MKERNISKKGEIIKKRRERLQQRINRIAITICLLLAIGGLIHTHYMFQDSAITTCKVISLFTSGLGSKANSKIVRVEYYVDGNRYESSLDWPGSDEQLINIEDSNGIPEVHINIYMDLEIGDRFRLKYSLKNPHMCRVLWNEGKLP